MVTGESGTGKEVVARELHRVSNLSGPFVAINCAALPEALVESELFGFTRGAFTGATQEKPGLVEVAQGGTLFLDEVTELPLVSQAKLLRVVETGEVRRIGSIKQRQIDCRILSATNHDLSRDIEQNRFRSDLAARLAEAELRLPPLRERLDDLPRLIQYLCRRSGHQLNLSAQAAEVLACYSWPLNIRELDNTLRFLGAVSQGEEIDVGMLPDNVLAGSMSSMASSRGPAEPNIATRPPSGQAKIQRVIDALRQKNGNIRAASKEIGVSRTYIYRCLDRSGMKPSDFR
jgi:two-component system NtrC family response regulator/two-component system response regulator AtoC